MNRFYKEERLCSKKFIDLLFNNGSSFLLYPYRVHYLVIEKPEGITSKISCTIGALNDKAPEVIGFPAKVLINVSKKRYKRAVDRNLIKRHCREVYRLQKGSQLYPLLADQNKLLLLSLQFIGKKIYDHVFFEKRLLLVFKKLAISLIQETQEPKL